MWVKRWGPFKLLREYPARSHNYRLVLILIHLSFRSTIPLRSISERGFNAHFCLKEWVENCHFKWVHHVAVLDFCLPLCYTRKWVFRFKSRLQYLEREANWSCWNNSGTLANTPTYCKTGSHVMSWLSRDLLDIFRPFDLQGNVSTI
jgi:hypothetical protein